MEFAKTKLLIASDGERTFVLFNGVPISCEEFSFETDGCSVRFSMKNVAPNRAFSMEKFADFVENEIGVKICREEPLVVMTDAFRKAIRDMLEVERQKPQSNS